MTLSMTLIVKFIVTILSVSCPLPVGIFTPCITIGCLIGRLYGEIIAQYVNITYSGGFALVGAASFTACVTRTTSVAIIIFELSG
jgi:H+/Cl- antiporter ClcA